MKKDRLELMREALLGKDYPAFEQVCQDILEGRPDHNYVLPIYARYLSERGDPRAHRYWRDVQKFLMPEGAEATFHVAQANLEEGMSPAKAVEAADRTGDEQFKAHLLRSLTEPVARVDTENPRHILAICGVSFCGSTLLDRLLGGLEGVGSIGESHWLSRDNAKGGGFQEFDTRSASPLITHPCLTCDRKCEYLTLDFRRDLTFDRTRRYQKIANRLGVDTLVTADKTPDILIEHDPLLNMSALVVFKSPIQAWASEFRLLPKDRDQAFYDEKLEWYLGAWPRNYRRLFEHGVFNGRKAVLNFDEFTLDPRPYWHRICEIFDLPRDDSVLDRSRPTHSVGGNHNTQEALRQGNYSIKVRPLKEPVLPPGHAERIAAHEEIQDLYQAMMKSHRALLKST